MKAFAFILVGFVGVCGDGRSDENIISVQGLVVRLDGVSGEALGEVRAVVEEQIALTDDSFVTPPLADDLTFFVRLRYRELGFRDAVLRWEMESRMVALHVKEGERHTVGRVFFEGNTSQLESDLTAYLLRPTHERVGASPKSTPFVLQDLKEGVDLVQRYYQSQGFLDVRIAPPAFAPGLKAYTVDVRLSIDEGQRYVFDAVIATGNLEGADGALAKLFKKLPGQPFNEVRVEMLRKNIVGIYEQRGHYSPAVLAEVGVNSNGRVPVVYRVTPGPIFHIGSVDISPGFSQGAQRIIRSNFNRISGDVYSPTELEFLTRHSLDTAIFSRLDVKLVPDANHLLGLDITGEEGPRTTLSASLGYDTFLGPFARAEARQVNVRDTGNSARIKAEYSSRGASVGFKWLDPAFLESAHSLDAEVAAQTFSFFDYERRSLSLRTTLKKRWNRNVATDVYAEGSVNDTLSDALTPEELGPAEYHLGIFGARIVLDYRDSPLLPTRGWVSSLGLASTSGDASFLRSDAMLAYYQRISKKFRAAFGVKSSAIHLVDGAENVPIDLRVFNGGANGVRSFAERQMGQRSRAGDTPLGGLMSQTASVELSYELRPNIELAVFGDAGNLNDTVANPLSPPSGLRYAIGLGLRYKLPIGPLRLDYGFNPDREDGEPIGAVQFTFGFAF
jgi:outer membrane protein insertion porin family